MKVMSDTMSYDLLVSRPELLERAESAMASGELDLVQTHIQVGQIEAIPDDKREKREAVLAVSSKIANVPVGAFVIGYSAIGDRIGEGSGIRVADIQAANGKHIEDALIAVSADIEADVLVTEDARLKNRVTRGSSRLRIWAFADFESHLAAL